MLQMNDNSFSFFLHSDSACLKFANEIKVQNGTSQDVHQKNLSFTGFRSPCSTNTHPHKLSIGQGPSLCR